MVFNTGAALLDAIVLAAVSKEPEGTYGYKITQLATAVWLTLVPKNRELAGQSEILQLQLKKFTPDI